MNTFLRSTIGNKLRICVTLTHLLNELMYTYSPSFAIDLRKIK